MKVKVTSTGIQRKGTPTTSNHFFNTSGHHLSTVTTISTETPCITIPRVPNKPSPATSAKAVTSRSSQDLVGTAKVLERKKRDVKDASLEKPVKKQKFIPASPSKLASVYYTPPSSSKTEQYPNQSKPRVQTVCRTNVKPVTHAIRLAVPSRKTPVKPEPTRIITVQSRKTPTVKQQPASTSTGTVKQKQVILRHNPAAELSTAQPKKQVLVRQDAISEQSSKPGGGKRETPKKPKKQEFIAFTPIPVPAATITKPATKRKAETATSKTPPSKIAARSSSKGAPVPPPTPPEVEVIDKNGATLSVVALVSDRPQPKAKPKKPKPNTVHLAGKEKQPPLPNYGSPKPGKAKKSHSVWTKSKNKNDTAKSPVAGEIRDLLHAFGDSSEPLPSTIQMMETCLRQELAGFIRICEQKAAIQGAKTLGITEAVVALRRDVPRMNRMYKHFGFKDIYEKKVLLQTYAPKISYTKTIQRIIRHLNMVNLFHLLEIGLDDIESSLQGIEDSKLEEAVRSSPEMLKFYQYAKTRSLSFARKLSTVNIRQWIITLCHVHAKVTDAFICVLDFLTLELVAEYVDLAFGIREERLVTVSEVRVANPDTCMSAPFFLKKRKDDRCNQVSEILVQASEMEATRLKKERKKKLGEGTRSESFTSRPLVILYPEYIREAYMRMVTDSNRPSGSFHVQAGLARPY